MNIETQVGSLFSANIFKSRVLTIFSIIEQLKNYQPKSIEVATLLFKPAAYQKNIPINYSAINVGNQFLVGFGLDYDGLGRNLEDIYIIEENS